MLKITVSYAVISFLTATMNCQFSFTGFGNQQQNNLQKTQAGIQQSDFAFPQTDFVFPNFFPQQQPFAPPRPQNNNYQGGQGGRPKPTFAPKLTTTRATPLAFAPQLQTGSLQANRLDERISQTSTDNVKNSKLLQFQSVFFIFFRMLSIL